MKGRIEINGHMTAKKGDIAHIDSFYDFQGLLPEGTWENCDEKGNPEDAGDWGIFRRDVDIRVKGHVK